MRVKPLDFREFLDRPKRLSQRRLLIFDNAGAPLKLIDGQSREGRAGATGGKRVARTRHVITQDRRRIVSQEDRARGDQ